MSLVAAAASARSRPRPLLRTLSDERLVARVRAGDEAAFEVVYDRYHRSLLSFCRHMLGTREEAEDALQQVCLSAYDALRADDRPIQLKAWLFTIARNRCLTVLRARREHADVDVVEPAVEGLAAEVQRREDLRAMLADLHGLPDDQRAALVLTELGAHTHDEVAVILGVRKEKVKALVFQAREQLHGARQARETDCADIREQLATLRGGALRRTQLRRHLEACAGCTAFKLEVQRQRAAIAVLLPVVPGAALKSSALAGVFGAGAGGAGAGGVGGGGAAVAGAGIAGAGAVAAGGAGGTFAAIGLQGAAVKALAAFAVVGGAGGSGYVAVHELRAAPPRAAETSTATAASAPAAPAAAPGGPVLTRPVGAIVPLTGGGIAELAAGRALTSGPGTAGTASSAGPGGGASGPAVEEADDREDREDRRDEAPVREDRDGREERPARSNRDRPESSRRGPGRRESRERERDAERERDRGSDRTEGSAPKPAREGAARPADRGRSGAKKQRDSGRSTDDRTRTERPAAVAKPPKKVKAPRPDRGDTAEPQTATTAPQPDAAPSAPASEDRSGGGSDRQGGGGRGDRDDD